METKGNIAKAIIAVMKAVKGIDKTMTVGSGNNSYKGVPDQEVKKVIGEAMESNGLCILPIGVDAKTKVDRWEETSTYSGQASTKMKQSVFTEATTKYLLLHESGESIELEGYGQGVDSQDKSAGKATTYALKYTLLYTFLVPTGKIDDSDANHSDEQAVPNKAQKGEQDSKQNKANTDNRPFITEKMFKQALEKIKAGDKDVLDKTVKAFQIKEEWAAQLMSA